MPTKEQEEQWQRADDAVRKNLPPGVKLLRTLRGHTDTIGRIAWSPDGLLLASPSSDRSVKVWEAENGRCRHTLDTHSHEVVTVAFDPKGGTLASAGNHSAVKLWDTNSGLLIRALCGENEIRSVAFDASGRYVVGGSNEGMISFQDATSGRLLLSIMDPRISRPARINSIAFDSTGTLLASGIGKFVQLWQDTAVHATREGHQGGVNSIVFHPTLRQVASGGSDNTVKIWGGGQFAFVTHARRTYFGC